MASKYRDPWLAICLGVLAFGGVAFAAHQQLFAVCEVSKVHPEKPKPPEEHSADEFTFDALANLVPNVNFDISQAAKRILTERACRGLRYEIWLRDLMGDDPKKRNRSLKILRHLHENVSNEILKPHFGVFVAVVDCLCTNSMIIEAATYEEEQEKGNTCYRSEHYDDVFRLLRRIIEDANEVSGDSSKGLLTAIRAGISDRWLVKYPWGGLTTSPVDTEKIVQRRIHHPNGDIHMLWLLQSLSRLHLPIVTDAAQPDSMMPGTGNVPTMSNAVDQRDRRESSRSREESPEERALRRRRREAVAIAEDGRPFGLVSAIQRVDNDADDNTGTVGVESDIARDFTNRSVEALLQNVIEVADPSDFPPPSGPEET